MPHQPRVIHIITDCLRVLVLSAWGLSAANSAAVEIGFSTSVGKPIAGAVVSLRSTDSKRPLATTVQTVMDQKSRAFAPGVVVVPVGSAISFPNSDSVSHQVYSFSPAKKFQLPLYRGKAHPPVLFDRPGAVTLGCNIHDQMRGFVFVTEGQYSGRTDTQGTWTEASVQPGEYKVTIWHPGSRDAKPVHEQNIVVTGGTDAQKFTLQASAALRLSKPTGQRPGWDEY